MLNRGDAQGRIKTKLGLMLQRKKGLFFLGIGACAFDTHRTSALRPTKVP